MIYGWDPKVCMLLPRQVCNSICTDGKVFHPENCQCVDQGIVDVWLYNYNEHWDKVELTVVAPHPLLKAQGPKKPRKTKKKK